LRACEQRSKTRMGNVSHQNEFPVCAGIRSKHQNPDHFLDAKRTAIRVKKMLCHRARSRRELGKR
jgi:hypothetical protein